MSTTMRKDKNAYNVHQKTQNGHSHQTLVVNMHWLNQTLDSFGEDEKSDKDEKNGVNEPGEGVGADISVRVTIIRTPPCDDGGDKTEQQRRTVEKHVESVG